ncbi:MAG: bifunctional riboflavin kinase/FAD synthetase [Bacteroidetes bacterium]|nr:bifunctional riboflavin kinase/FAD synthetase [Bacteroidota bacterium]HET6243870.1 bifunctional riboflavin kinase/FAD synthetase [Bacteroidia bacterium]
MRVYFSLDEFNEANNPVVTTGTFDGVHIGHQTIIKRLKELAEKENGETVLITFFPHPRMVLYPSDDSLKLINTQEEKIELLDKYGINHLIVIPFTKEFSRLSSIEFVRNILVNKVRTKKLVIGYNHHFGRNREGSFEHLKEFGPVYGFEVEEIPAQDMENVSVSSTKIRAALLEGDINTANSYLGHPYSLRGNVVLGNKLGREIGFPTANIKIPEKYKLIPANGVYVVDVIIENSRFQGMLNIGNNPTVNNNNKEQTIEVHIFDFSKDIYGQKIIVEFKDRIRDEIKFENLEQLKEQLEKDKKTALQF